MQELINLEKFCFNDTGDTAVYVLHRGVEALAETPADQDAARDAYEAIAKDLALAELKADDAMALGPDLQGRLCALEVAIMAILYLHHCLRGDPLLAELRILGCVDRFCKDPDLVSLVTVEFSPRTWSFSQSAWPNKSERHGILAELRAVMVTVHTYFCGCGRLTRLPSIKYGDSVVDVVHEPHLQLRALQRENVKTYKGHTVNLCVFVVDEYRMFSSAFDCFIMMWDVRTMNCVGKLAGHSGRVHVMTVDRGRLYSGSFDHTIKVWDIQKQECVATLTGHDERVFALACVGDRLFSGSFDKSIMVWDTNRLLRLSTVEREMGRVLVFVLQGSRLYAGHDDNEITLWEVLDIQVGILYVSTLTGHSDAVLALAAQENRLFSGSFDTTIKIWDTELFECLHTFTGHSGRVTAIALEGGRLFSGADDGCLKVWDLQQKRCVCTFLDSVNGERAMVFIGGRLFLGRSDGKIQVYGDPTPVLGESVIAV